METSCSRPQPSRPTPKLNTAQYANLLRREALKIVVLGPGEAQPFDLKKRRQIKSRLIDQGYTQAELGEDVLGNPEMPLHLAFRNALSDIDLVLVLNTGAAPLTELTAISFDSRAREITRVWSKREFAGSRRSTPGDVLKMFDNYPFSVEEFDSCELVESFVDTAERFCFSKAQSEGRLEGLGILV